MLQQTSIPVVMVCLLLSPDSKDWERFDVDTMLTSFNSFDNE